MGLGDPEAPLRDLGLISQQQQQQIHHHSRLGTWLTSVPVGREPLSFLWHWLNYFISCFSDHDHLKQLPPLNAQSRGCFTWLLTVSGNKLQLL